MHHSLIRQCIRPSKLTSAIKLNGKMMPLWTCLSAVWCSRDHCQFMWAALAGSFHGTSVHVRPRLPFFHLNQQVTRRLVAVLGLASVSSVDHENYLYVGPPGPLGGEGGGAFFRPYQSRRSSVYARWSVESRLHSLTTFWGFEKFWAQFHVLEGSTSCKTSCRT